MDFTLTARFSQPVAAQAEQPAATLEALAARLKAGDSTALEPFIARTQTAAFRLAASYLKDEHAAQDALQEAYLLVYQRIDQLKEPEAVKGWFFQIVRSCCHRQLRKRKDECSLETVSEVPLPSRSSRDDVEVAFAQLNDQDRTVLTLREVWEFSYQEMAETLEVPLGTVRSRLAKARQRFLKVFRGESRS